MDRQNSVVKRPFETLRRTVADFAAVRLPEVGSWCVALSGGADSLALTAAAATVLPTTALIIDHGLQTGSDAVAAAAHDQARRLGCIEARVIVVRVGTDGGPEAAARTARYAALDEARAGAPVLLAHTLDDQAETVLLGLGRGSGSRSIAGMRPVDPPWFRPLLAHRRATTGAVCEELGLRAWNDPHNIDPRFTRVRLRREVLPLLEEVLGPGVAEALARTADGLREDNDALDALAAHHLAGAAHDGALEVAAVSGLPDALRLRVIRGWLLAGGAGALTAVHIRAVDALVTSWHGQGGVAVASTAPAARLFAERSDGVLRLRLEPV